MTDDWRAGLNANTPRARLAEHERWISEVSIVPHEVRAMLDNCRRWIESAPRKAVLALAKLDGLRTDYEREVDQDRLRGEKTLAAARKGHEKTHGTPDQKQARRHQIFALCKEIAAEKPSWKLGAIRKEAAERSGCGLRTVERHTKMLRDALKK